MQIRYLILALTGLPLAVLVTRIAWLITGSIAMSVVSEVVRTVGGF